MSEAEIAELEAATRIFMVINTYIFVLYIFSLSKRWPFAKKDISVLLLCQTVDKSA